MIRGILILIFNVGALNVMLIAKVPRSTISVYSSKSSLLASTHMFVLNNSPTSHARYPPHPTPPPTPAPSLLPPSNGQLLGQVMQCAGMIRKSNMACSQPPTPDPTHPSPSQSTPQNPVRTPPPYSPPPPIPVVTASAERPPPGTGDAVRRDDWRGRGQDSLQK